MTCLRIGLSVALLLALSVTAPAQDTDAGRRAASDVRLPDTLEGWLVPAEALPDGVTLSDEFVTNSQQAWTFFDDPTTAGVLPAPTAKISQTLVTPGEGDEALRGCLMALEYEGDVPEDVAAMVPGLMWGPEGAPSGLHPENIIMEGPYLVILSFAVEDPTGDWLRGRLHEERGLSIPRSWGSLTPVINAAIEAMRAGDDARGLAALDARSEDISDYALAQILTGDLAMSVKDYARAEQGYARALQLHDEQIDKLPGDEVSEWIVLDGLGLALIIQDKIDAGIPVLERAVGLADALEKPEEGARSRYNLACAYAKVDRFDDAHATLARCIEVRSEYYTGLARDDTDFAVARERDDFKALLGL